MNKKKLVVSLLILVMILSLALTALVGCKDDDNTDPDQKDTAPDGYKKMNTSLATALTEAVYNTASEKRINSLAASASLKVTATYGESVSEYLITLGANVALDTTNNNPTTFGLSIVDTKANNANILNAYYYEYPDLEGASRENYKTGRGTLYIDLGSGANQQKFAVNGLSIKSVLKSEGVNVDNAESDAIIDKVGGGIESALNTMSIVFNLGEVYQKNDNSEVLFSLSLAKVFENAGSLLDGLSVIDEYTEKLGLALKSTDIKTLLPALTLDLHIKMEDAGADDFEDAIIAGVDAKIGVASKDFKITRTDGSNFVRINIDKDVSLGLDLDFQFGGTANIPGIIGGSYDAYKAINAINFTAGGELTLNKGIEVTFNLNGDKTIGIPTGTYSIDIAADINPVALLGTTFDASTTDKLLDMVSNILEKAVNYLNITIVDKNNPTDTTKQLIVSLVKTGGTLKVSLTNLALLGDIGAMLPGGTTVSLTGDGGLMSIIKGILSASDPADPGSGEGSGNADASGNTNASGDQTASGEEEADIDAILDIIAGIVKNLTIGVNDGSDLLKVIFENYVIASNELEDANGKPIDTTISASIIGNKTSGLTAKVDVKGIVMGQNSTDISAEIKVNGDGITVTAKTSDAFKFGDIELPIDLVLKLNKFELGAAKAA